MNNYLFTVSGHDIIDSIMGLLPGIPRSLLLTQAIGSLQQGSILILILPNGSIINTYMYNYYIKVPADYNIDPSTVPIIPVLPPDLGPESAPIGTKVYASGVGAL